MPKTSILPARGPKGPHLVAEGHQPSAGARSLGAKPSSVLKIILFIRRGIKIYFKPVLCVFLIKIIQFLAKKEHL